MQPGSSTQRATAGASSKIKTPQNICASGTSSRQTIKNQARRSNSTTQSQIRENCSSTESDPKWETASGQ